MSPSDLAFSIVVNTTDRADSLKVLLYALENQSYTNFEVIVVVGPTRDNTLEVLEAYQGRLRVLRCAAANLSVSRNIGLRAATGEIVAYIDDDAVPCRHWLLQLKQVFANSEIHASGGIVYLVHPNQPAVQHRLGIVSAMAEQIDVRWNPLEGLPASGPSRLWTQRMMGTNMAYRRASLLAIGGFDEFYEWVFDDADVAFRLALAGKTVHPVVEACVYHVPASSRNRVAYTYLGRWWIQTKAAIYFAVKNSHAIGAPRAPVARRLAHLVHGHWLWTAQLHKEGRITLGQMSNMRWQELKSSAIGLRAALFAQRNLLAPASRDESSPIFLPFAGATTAGRLAAIDPVSGRSATVMMPEPPMHIALLSHSYPPARQEGVGRSTNLLAKGLFELGHHVHVITHGVQERVTFYDGAYVHQIPYKLERYANLRHLPKTHHLLNYSHAVHEKVRRLMLNDGIELVDTPLWQTDGFVTALSRRLPVVVRPTTALRQIAEMEGAHDLDAQMVGQLEEELLRRADYLAANSLSTVKALQDIYRLDLDSVRYGVIPYGIEPVAEAEVRPFPVERPPAALTVLYVGRMEKRKGIQDLFAAIPSVLAHVANVRFIIAGADNSESDGFRRRTGLDYRTYFTRHYPGAATAVEFLGHVDDRELQRLYQECDLFVAPSLYESFGLIYTEAMNYAKPVIASNAGAIPEVVEDGVTGLLVDPEAPAQLAEAIVRMLQRPNDLRDFGLAGRARLLARFTHVAMARGFAVAYRSLLQQQGSAAPTLPAPVILANMGIEE